jgi:hypothetical protein
MRRRERLTPILFGADRETLIALAELGDREGARKRSEIIRRAIVEARDRARSASHVCEVVTAPTNAK